MKWLTWPGLDRARDMGLLVLRVGLGLMMMFHGWPKMVGGADKWRKLGGAMSSLGVDFAPEFWGFMAAFAELIGGAALVLGLATRPFALMLAFTMFVAARMHLEAGDGLGGASHAIEDGIAFLGILLLGPGRYSLDQRLR